MSKYVYHTLIYSFIYSTNLRKNNMVFFLLTLVKSYKGEKCVCQDFQSYVYILIYSNSLIGHINFISKRKQTLPLHSPVWDFCSAFCALDGSLKMNLLLSILFPQNPAKNDIKKFQITYKFKINVSQGTLVYQRGFLIILTKTTGTSLE